MVSEGGSAHLLDIPTRSLTRTVDLGIPQDQTVGTNEVVLAPDGKRMYVGLENVSDFQEVVEARCVFTIRRPGSCWDRFTPRTQSGAWRLVPQDCACTA